MIFWKFLVHSYFSLYIYFFFFHIEAELNDGKIVKCIDNSICAQSLLNIWHVLSHSILIRNLIYSIYYYDSYYINESSRSPSSEKLPIFIESRRKHSNWKVKRQGKGCFRIGQNESQTSFWFFQYEWKWIQETKKRRMARSSSSVFIPFLKQSY